MVRQLSHFRVRPQQQQHQHPAPGSKEPHSAFAMKGDRSRLSRAPRAWFGPSSNFAARYNAFAIIEREKGTFEVRGLVQLLTRPRTFTLVAVFLLLAPPLWFASRTAVPVIPVAAELEERIPVLPVETFRDVPPEECLRSPLWNKKVDPSEYEFGCEKINALLAGEKELIGNGVIRDVYLVEHEGRKLVIKALRDDYEQRASKSRVDNMHRWEAAALDVIRGHPNMVDMLGFCGTSSVSEYFDVRLDDLILGPGAKPMPISLVVSMALDAARGLQALHEAPGGAIVHFDIKPQQLMLDGNGKIKINDLNMLRFADADAGGNTCPFESDASRVGPFRSPENIAGEKLTEKVDIYSMAMVYYCMLALHPPYTNVPDGKSMITNGVPPPTDPSWHVGFLEIVQDMWQRDPQARPSARRVVRRLEILQKQLATGDA